MVVGYGRDGSMGGSGSYQNDPPVDSEAFTLQNRRKAMRGGARAAAARGKSPVKGAKKARTAYNQLAGRYM
tara:strand:+ start:85 stop:297 length:213 start_codon:yes stop_codon:yes gene_type:complete